MSPSRTTWLLVILSLLYTTAKCQPRCGIEDPEPIVLEYGNVTLRDGVQSWGIPMAVGGQMMALQPHSFPPVSYVCTIPASCLEKPDPLSCATSRALQGDEVLCGGLYNSADSPTHSGPFDFPDLDLPFDEPAHRPPEDHFYFKDNSQVGNDSINLEDISFVTSPHMNHGGVNYIGLGKSSLILDSLWKLGRIPSRVWGFWGGWTGVTPTTTQPGALVIGGYDASKVAGDLDDAQFDIKDDSVYCNLRFIITDIKIRALNAVEKSIFEDGQSMDACVSPYFNSISLPRSMVNAITVAGGNFTLDANDQDRALGLYMWGFQVPVEKNTGFSLVFEIANKTRIVIPNHQLFNPYRFTTPIGYEIQDGKETQVLRLNALQDTSANHMAQLGWPFMSAAYILVDHEVKKFKIAQAVDSIVSKTSIVPIKTGECTNAPRPSASETPPSDNEPQESDTPSSGSSKPPVGPIVGGVLGVVALFLIAGIAWFLIRRRYDDNSYREDKYDIPLPPAPPVMRRAEMDHGAPRPMLEGTLRAELPDRDSKGYINPSFQDVRRGPVYEMHP